jgi:hypothetical protein
MCTTYSLSAASDDRTPSLYPVSARHAQVSPCHSCDCAITKARIVSSSAVGCQFDHQGTSLPVIVILLTRHFPFSSSQILFLTPSLRSTVYTPLLRQTKPALSRILGEKSATRSGHLRRFLVGYGSLHVFKPRTRHALILAFSNGLAEYLRRAASTLGRLKIHKTEGCSANAQQKQLGQQIDATTKRLPLVPTPMGYLKVVYHTISCFTRCRNKQSATNSFRP